jgi:hypothetical protein
MASNVIDSVFFGTLDDLDSATVRERTEMAEMNNGLKIVRHVKSKSLELERVSSLCDSYGIGGSDVGDERNTLGEILTGATYEKSEVISELCMDTNPVFSPEAGFLPDTSKIMLFYKNMIWLGHDETITLNFRYRGVGTPTYPGGSPAPSVDALVAKLLKAGYRLKDTGGAGPGGVDTFSVGPAVTPVVLAGLPAPYWPYILVKSDEADANERFIVQDSEKNQSEDWHTAQCTLIRRVPAPNQGESPLAPELRLFNKANENVFTGDNSNLHNEEWLGWDLNAAAMEGSGGRLFFRCTINFALSESGNAQLTETVEVFPADPNSPAFDIS